MTPAIVYSHENRVLVGAVEVTLVSEHEPWPLMEEKLPCLGRIRKASPQAAVGSGHHGGLEDKGLALSSGVQSSLEFDSTLCCVICA